MDSSSSSSLTMLATPPTQKTPLTPQHRLLLPTMAQHVWQAQVADVLEQVAGLAFEQAPPAPPLSTPTPQQTHGFVLAPQFQPRQPVDGHQPQQPRARSHSFLIEHAPRLPSSPEFCDGRSTAPYPPPLFSPLHPHLMVQARCLMGAALDDEPEYDDTESDDADVSMLPPPPPMPEMTSPSPRIRRPLRMRKGAYPP